MRTVDQLVEFFDASQTHAIAELLREELDVPSPLIGSRGPGFPGPEEPYVPALRRCTPAGREKTGQAFNQILLVEGAGVTDDRLPHPFLVFNILKVLQGVALPQTVPALGAMRHMMTVLQRSLADRNEDLYRQTLYALAINQTDKTEKEFWRSLLTPAMPREYLDIAALGLRKLGWDVGCETLVKVAEAFQGQQDSASIRRIVMLLVDEHPEAHWPKCAYEFVNESKNPELWALVQQYSPGRYTQSLAELPAEPGTALEYLQQNRPQRLPQIEQSQKRRTVPPAAALKAA